MSRVQKGFGVIEGLLILVILGILGFTGWYVWHSKNSTDKTLNTASSTSQSAITKPDPYAGWKTASLKYEKISFKYPSSWQISNISKDEAATGGTVTPGSDSVVLTSTSGLVIDINAGVAGVDTTGVTMGLPTSEPITTLGGHYYLVFYTNKAQSTTEARGACVSKTSTTQGIPYIPSKNIQLAGVSAVKPAVDLICIGYQGVQGVTPVKPISTFKQDSSYKDAKLIIESLAY